MFHAEKKKQTSIVANVKHILFGYLDRGVSLALIRLCVLQQFGTKLLSLLFNLYYFQALHHY